jgi:hypothetical protein
MGETYTVISSKVGIFRGMTLSRKVILFFEDKGKAYRFDPTSAVPSDPHLQTAKKRLKTAPETRAPVPVKREAPARNPLSPTKKTEPKGLSLC